MKSVSATLALAIAALAASAAAGPIEGRDIITKTFTFDGTTTVETITFDPPGSFPTGDVAALAARDVITTTVTFDGTTIVETITFDPPGSFPTGAL
ncbi:uncharacterized protein BXZ73DRAFT_104305 [Epithele typhae]|uniref:uncharacterized protein n=1 Tax=Epithele typhae TaxID=378194 RepID=UPI0020077CCA|nr:uncharacterized protein BXZ73DRAFT_104305 [Epithele typhae]KAH9921685.1 hypothetical protein BXZ73DRAFT_104305 [Epithele typhae]